MASHDFPVAVIGMAVKLPGADNCNDFWELMVNQRDTVTEFPKERAADIEHVLPAFKGQFVDEDSPFFTGSFFKSVDGFDPDMFGINPKEALFIEPEQRIFLQTVWELLEDAGYASKIRDSNTGVYVGNTVNKYKYILTENHPSISHGNHSPFISSRVSYTFNLTGPAMMVATGCSSSLLAVHLACQGLLSGDCEMAIAGGITLDLLPISLKTDIWNQLGITSPNAKCRAFDAAAKGIAKAEGCGIVLLKPLEKAISDGDNIYGILEATTANQDGHSQGITAPHPGAQSNMLVKAWELANITPDKLGYIECHGTGTELGDPIEIMGITKAYQKMVRKNAVTKEKIPIGSVKANIGHLADGAAGIVSLIKVLLCMKNNTIPPVTNFSSPNPHINWERAPVEVNQTLKKWVRQGSELRYGGVSAFGLLGTNIHTVVKEYKPIEIMQRQLSSAAPHLLCIAAKTTNSFKQFIGKLLNHLDGQRNMSYEEFSKICFSLNTGRELRRFKNRLAVVSNDISELILALESFNKDNESCYRQIEIKTVLQKSNPTDRQAEIIDQFLRGDRVDWIEYYKSQECDRQTPIGLLPTYCFEMKRFWPEALKTLNKQYLVLEHQVPMDCEVNDRRPDTVIETIRCKSNQLDINKILIEAFNNALGNQNNWTEEGDTNLFDLGVDSLVYTHLTIYLQQIFNKESDIIFTQTDLHAHPTFNKLCRFMKEKLANRQTHEKISDKRLSTSGALDLGGKFPLSFSQRRLWVIEKMEKAGCTYNATDCLKITGNLNVEALTKSVNAVLNRHDAFFVTVEEVNEEPCMVHNWNKAIGLEEVDFSLFCHNAEEKAMEAYHADYKTQFDLSKGPLVRVKLYKLGRNQYILTTVIHHIIYDGWSHFLFQNEMWNNYNKYSDGKFVLTEMQRPLSVAFSSMEIDASKSVNSRMQRDMQYWLEKLSFPLPLSTFPGDRKRPRVFTYEGGRLTRFIDIDVFRRLNKSVEGSHTMFHSILASVFMLMQYFNPSETDFVIGIPVTGRHTHEMRDIIGCFINTLVIRLALTKAMNYDEILQTVVKTCFEAQEHQLAPFDNLVSRLRLPRNTAISPIFSVNVCYHNEELKHAHISPPEELNIERKLLHNSTSKWDLQFDFLEENSCMRFTLEYYKGVFSKKYAEIIVDMLVKTIETASKSPHLPLTDFRIGEASILKGPKVFHGNATLTDTLKQSLEEHPESVIKDITGKTYTYRTLKREAAQLANFFMGKCLLRKGDRVGLLFENSYEGLRVIVACLLSGIVYVPLNPDNPKLRTEQIVRSSGIKLLCFSKDTFALACYVQWSCENVYNIFCIEDDEFSYTEEKYENPLMDTELWNCVADEAASDIEGGGWKSSFTGEYMSKEEMEEYVTNVTTKLEKHIDTQSLVLEIGCASGLTTQSLCTKVKKYVATDISESMVMKLREKNLNNVQAHCLPAHEIEKISNGCRFDLIILNSVVHCFPGYNYLRKVIEMCATLLASDGKVFVGDVMDMKKREDLEYALRAFKAANPTCRTKTDLSAELFIPEEFFYSFHQMFPTTVCTPKLGKIENELTMYRYDVLMTNKTTINLEKRNHIIRKERYSVYDVNFSSDEKCSVDDVHFGDDVYILHTSGTTGCPKGVRISQKSLLNYCKWAASAYSLTTDSRIPLFSPLTFDFTVTSIFPPMLHGSSIMIYKPFSESYEDIGKATSLTVAKFSPLQLETILASRIEPLSMDTFVLGGEEVTFDLLRKLKENKGNCPFIVWNEYGPTEATVGCIVKSIESKDIEKLNDQYVPIGKPIDNVTIAVTAGSNAVPLGTKGFLAIGGPCLTSGFIQSNKEHVDAFKSACWDKDGSLMYTTTDIASISVDKDEVYYFGRDSSDITKINEIRVDISEVQSVIRKLPFVEEVWASRFEMNGSDLLGAAVRLSNCCRYKDEDLKSSVTKELARILPTYSIPKVFVQLDDAPTNKNGKKDNVLLRKLFIKAMEKTTELTCDRPNETEEKVQKIWQEILPINRLPGLTEDFFFELSGDSLQAIHAVRKLRNAGFKLTVNDIFKNPTIKSFCRSLDCQTSGKKYQSPKTESNEPFRPTPIAERYMQLKGTSDRFAVPALLELGNPLAAELVQKALKLVILKHRSLCSRFFVENGKILQQFIDIRDRPEVIETEISSKCTNLVENNVFTRTCNYLENQLDIEKGNLMNAAIFRLDNKNYCLIVIHHITVDIVSWQQILEDLALAIEIITSGNTQSLPEPSTPFDYYCNALWKEGENCSAEEIRYWEDVTKSDKSSATIGQGTEQSIYANARWESESIEADIVRNLSIAVESTNEAVILTALGKAFSELEEISLTVCLESHGRQINLDTTDTVGWCTSMFPFTIRARQGDSFAMAARSVKADIHDVPSHGVRYGPLVGTGKLKSELPNAMFVFQGSLDASSKEEFKAGKSSFRYMPWVEVLTHDLENGHYHRDKQDRLDFPLEIICWFHSNYLRVGSLFDGKKISNEWVRNLLTATKQILVDEGREIDQMSIADTKNLFPLVMKSKSVQIISNITIAPEMLPSVQHILNDYGFENTEITLADSASFYQLLMQKQPSTHYLTLVIIKLVSENQSKEIEQALHTFIHHNQKNGNKLVTINLQTLSSLVPLGLRNKQENDFRSIQFAEDDFDRHTEAEFNIPLTQKGHMKLAIVVSREICAHLRNNAIKVICVDADYTLWNGECANNEIKVSWANKHFQNFLAHKKHQGYLLVLLSKNRQEDVEAALSREDMILKKEHFIHLAVNWEPKTLNITDVSKMLDLSLESFMFIDDSMTECEEMLRVHPQVKSLRYPSEENIVEAFVSSLWILDNTDITSEASRRTEMYQSELARINGNTPDVRKQNHSDFLSMLVSWNMKMNIWKTSIVNLRSKTTILKRVTELLHRTNQFKLNDTLITMDDFNNHDTCLVVSLEDNYGSYGTIAVIVTDHEDNVKQWVMSCRALGRKVEERILLELFQQSKRKRTELSVFFKKTRKNDPIQNFVKNLCTSKHQESDDYFSLDSKKIQNAQDILGLHSVYYSSEPSASMVDNTPKSNIEIHNEILRESNSLGNLDNLRDWLLSNLSTEHIDHIFQNCVLPPFLLRKNARLFQFEKLETKEQVSVLEDIWKRTLNIEKDPHINDNFIKEGGSSFQAVFFISEIHAAFGIKLELMDVLTKPFQWLNELIQATKGENANFDTPKSLIKKTELSQAQRRMWMMQISTKSSTAYTESIALKMHTKDPVSEIKTYLIGIHPILTATLDKSANWLRIGEDNISVTDRHYKDMAQLGNEIAKSKPVFDETEKPLCQIMSFQFEDFRVVVVHVHHILVDDITLNNIKKSLKKFNEITNRHILIKCSSVDGKKKFHSVLKKSIVEECNYLTSEVFEKDKLFWDSVYDLESKDSCLSSTPISEVDEFLPQTANTLTERISIDICNQIQYLSRDHGVTEFQFLLACFVLVIQRYVANEEIVVAVPVSTRSSDNISGDGLFVNTVLFRYLFNMDQTLKHHIRNVSDTWMEYFSHANYPVDQVGNTIWKKHGKSLSSICSAMFNLATFKTDDDELEIKPKHAKMPFTVDVKRDKSGLKIVAEYAVELMDSYVVENLIASFVNILTNSKRNEDLPLREIEVLSDEHLNRLESFSLSLHPQTQLCNVFELFLRNSKSKPNNVALVCQGRRISYRKLNKMIHIIATRLLEETDLNTLGAKPVVIFMEKSPEAVAAMLAVWKVGGFFMPVSTMYSSSVHEVIESVKPCIVLADTTQGERKSLSSNCAIMNINGDFFADVPEREFPSTLDLDRSAYMIRTSGSTGTPKKIAIGHRCLATLAGAWTSEYKLSSYNVNLLQWAPISFDVFVGDIVRGLCCSAGKVVLCPDNMRLDTDYIIKLIMTEEISIAEMTPQFGLMLTQQAIVDELQSLKVFILGSDILQREVYHKVKRYFKPHQRLLNSYGMTEATIDSSFFEGDEIPVTKGGTIPIGKPLPGVIMKVLDPGTLRPCPVGTIGELFIGGNVIGSGDVDIVKICEERMLRTNDYASWLSTGDLEICGRKDSLLKLRGFRIDSTQIENMILKHNEFIIDVSVSILTGDKNSYMCAFVVLSDEINQEVLKSLKEKLRESLPYYMVPDFIESVPNIPLTQNGKVDKKRLPTLNEILKKKTVGLKQEQSDLPVARELRKLFAESLGIDPSCIQDSCTFMEQGGHSLVLMKFCSLIGERTNFDLSIVDIFSYPSVKFLTEKALKFTGRSESKTAVEQPDIPTIQTRHPLDIAICGVGLRLPRNVQSISEFWELLEHQTDLISDFPQHRKDDVLNCSTSELLTNLRDAAEFRGAFIRNVDNFDNAAFNIPSTEAQFMAPEQRMFLEVASETLVQATNISEVNGSNIGVFLSQAEIGYARLNHPDEATAISGFMPGMIATRVAYHFNLKGPTMLIDTACSSGISAMKAACDALEKGECKAALVGGMNLILYPSRTGVHGNSGILSPDFKCRPFDKHANGTGVGEGMLCFYLEPLQDALKYNKHVYGIIKSIGINSVGKGNGITAPTAQSQEKAIRSALDLSGLKPSDISFVETHGTGTVLGDKIELSALSSVFNNRSEKLPIGSVKSNFGHLDYAAGLAGLLKIIAGYMFNTIPPTMNFENPHEELLKSNLYVPTVQTAWNPSQKSPRFAGLSSFGLTGTNTHMIISDVIKTGNIHEGITERVPFLLCGATYDHIRRQASLFEVLIQQTVVKHKINTIRGVAISVVLKLQQLQKSKLLHTKHRIAIPEADIETLLSNLRFIKSCKNETELQNSKSSKYILYAGDDIEWNEEPLEGSSSSGIKAFLKCSRIEADTLIANAGIDKSYCAPGLVLSIFASKRHWLQPTVRKSHSSLGLIDIIHGKIGQTRELVRSLNLSPPIDLLEYEARFCCSIILYLLKGTGLKEIMETSEDITLDTAFDRTGMVKKYDKLFFIMIRELLNYNLVKPKGSDPGRLKIDIFSFNCRDVCLSLPQEIAQKAVIKFPQWADCFRFPLHCAKYLKEVLWGEKSPLSVIYPQGDLNFMYQFDKLGDLLGDVYYNMYMQIIVEYAAKLSMKGKKVRILEVGAGMGHVTRQLLPSLSDIPNIEYWFTDLGRAFVENAKTLFEKYTTMMRFSTFDITKSAVKQGLLGSYDIVISYNVIHTTESVYKSVTNLRTCLGDDGTLFIIESAKNETWATLAWGILDGWWYFKDYDLRPYEPMLEPEKWEEVLEKSGFKSVFSFPMDESERKHVEKFLFVCSNKEKYAEHIAAPTQGWWKSIDLSAHRHADFDTDSSCSDESGLGEDSKVSRFVVKSELKRIWCELLDLEEIHDDEDFNALGGESLLAIQMMTMVRKRIGFQLEIADTFCYTSLGSLGDYISDQLEAEASQQSNSESSTNATDDESQAQISETVIESEFVDKQHCLLMFPGQGSQKLGMCTSMRNSEAATEIFEQAEKILGYNILDICTGPEDLLKEKLKSTEFVQVALFVSCLAKVSQIYSEDPRAIENVTHVAGLSVGEFAALVFAKVLKFEDALILVQKRGRAMEKEVDKASTAMASVLGPSKDELELFLKEVLPETAISTYLADNQHTVAGTEDDIDRLTQMLSNEERDRLSVMDVRKLRVAGGFHSQYMEMAEKNLRSIIEPMTFQKPEVAIIMNVTGQLCDDPDIIKTLVSRQIVDSVQWRESMVTAYNAGIRHYIELSPSRVLSSIVRTRIELCKGCKSGFIQV